MPSRASQKLIAAVTLLRAMPAPSTPEAWNLHREAQALIKQAAVQQAESSASRIRQQGSARDAGGAQGPEASVHAGSAVGQLANQGCTPVKERILDTRGARRSRSGSLTSASLAPMGGTLRHGEGTQARHVQAGQRGRGR
jgi:hypothetical protein